MKTLSRGILVSVLSAGLSMGSGAVAAQGQALSGDARVGVLLGEAGLEYEVDGDGDYRLVSRFDDGRSQLVFIMSDTLQLGGLEIREVWSVGYMADSFMPASVARNLLRENGELKLGAWQLGELAGREAGIFRAQIGADAELDTLLMAIKVVSATADAKEQELVGHDDL